MIKDENIRLKCWNCKATYLFEGEAGEQKIRVVCPHCRKESLVDFAPYGREKKIVMRSVGEKVIGVEYNLPKVILTEKE